MEVQVVHIDRQNVDKMWPRVLLALVKASFVSLDFEMSGLGDREAGREKQLSRRYAMLMDTVKTRGILSLGLSCFTKDQASNSYTVHVFDIVLKSTQDFILEHDSTEFLLKHGFDFNYQLLNGLRYCPYTSESLQRPALHGRDYLQSLIDLIVKLNVQLVVHNGLLDLMFLHQHLWCPLPDKVSTFVSHIHSMFGSVWDTKHLASCTSYVTSSALEPLFTQVSARHHDVTISMPAFLSLIRNTPYVSTVAAIAQPEKEMRQQDDSSSKLSASASASVSALKKEDIGNGTPDCKRPKPLIARCQGHRAGYDSFMTGFIFAYFQSAFDQQRWKSEGNKIHLSGKTSHPMMISSSRYSKPSNFCDERRAAITQQKEVAKPKPIAPT